MPPRKKKQEKETGNGTSGNELEIKKVEATEIEGPIEVESLESSSNIISNAKVTDEMTSSSSSSSASSSSVPSSSTAAPPPIKSLQQRLFDLKNKINVGRKANKSEVESEYKRMIGKGDGNKNDSDNEGENDVKKAGKKKGKTSGDDDYMNVTAAQAERVIEKQQRKEEEEATFGFKALAGEAMYNGYKKQIKKLTSNRLGESSGEGLAISDPLQYGTAGANVSQIGLERLSQHIHEREETRLKSKRHRMEFAAADVDYINDKNAQFNKKLSRSFDKYTVEIRQNLERGTAL